MKPSEFLNKKDKELISNAIKNAELNTSGEIRVHLENRCRTNPLDRATYLFEKLAMHKTEKRNGVLFYLAVKDKKFAILGDAGINKVTPDNFWDDIKETMLEHFQEKEFAKGLEKGIEMAGEQLKGHFPYQTDDKNELSDEISFGSN